MDPLAIVVLYFGIGMLVVMTQHIFMKPWPSEYFHQKGKPSDVWWLFTFCMFFFWPFMGPIVFGVKYGTYLRKQYTDEG